MSVVTGAYRRTLQFLLVSSVAGCARALLKMLQHTHRQTHHHRNDDSMVASFLASTAVVLLTVKCVTPFPFIALFFICVQSLCSPVRNTFNSALMKIMVLFSSHYRSVVGREGAHYILEVI